MGVAAFYRWLTRKYPKVQTYVVEEKPTNINGIVIPVDATKPNPNGVEFDNLYLDMNGIVHPCCHPQFRKAPETEEEMMIEIFKCLDRVFAMIRPRKLVYMAIDGVAPRAKMNQQRSRRFRAAQEAEEKEAAQAKAAEEVFQATGERPAEFEKPWDSNCITPGTPFMELLAKSLRYYVALKLNSDPAWRNVKVILSDSNVPGEGEHKIMDYIRRQRMMAAHDPNTSHVLYGLDADLIMLSLATHEPHFKILREDVQWADMLGKPCRICGKKGHFQRNCLGAGNNTPDVDPNDQPFVFANIDILREYLEIELQPERRLPFRFDLERAIDDWVFMCFFVGNDFLPHLPSLEIREGAIEKLIAMWKEELPTNGGYLTHNGDVDLERVQPIMHRLAELEDETFVERKRQEDQRERSRMQREEREQRQNNFGNQKQLDAAADHMSAVAAANARKEREAVDRINASNKAAANALKEQLAAKKAAPAVEDEEVLVSGSTVAPAKRMLEDSQSNDGQDSKRVKLDNETEETDGTEGAGETETTASKPASTGPQLLAPDDILLHEDGYKERFYRLKFHLSLDDTDAIHTIAEHYVRGLCWVLKYYYQGCASWGWYYPYHYAPFASDLTDVATMDVSFTQGAPIRPYEQLMAVLPARSRHNLPKPFSPLMTLPTSPIIDFYPTDFPLDLNGKKFLWQAVILLPFIDQDRLLTHVQSVYPQLTDDERRRNAPGSELLMVSAANPLYESLCDLYMTADSAEEAPLNPRLSARMTATVSRDPLFVPHTSFASPLTIRPDIAEDKSISAVFHRPTPKAKHTAVLLPHVTMPRKTLSQADADFVLSGGKSGYRGGPRGPHHGNNRDFSHFYRQQGDVSQDRGRGPRRFDEFGNQNQDYRSQNRPVAYQPFAGRSAPTVIAVPGAQQPASHSQPHQGNYHHNNSRGRGGYRGRGNYRGDSRGGHRGGRGGGYRGGYRGGRGGY